MSINLTLIAAVSALGNFPTPLQPAAQKCLELLAQVAHGIPPARSSNSMERPNHKKNQRNSSFGANVDILSAGVYSFVDLSLISESATVDLHDTNNPDATLAKSLSPLDILYSSPIRVSESVWIRGAKAFGEASHFTLLHSGSMVR